MVFSTLHSRFRRLLQMRKERALPRRGSKPAIGSYIAREDLRITIQAGMSDQLWRWLLEQGWRELRYRPEHRRYRDVPAICVRQLIDAPAAVRQQALNAAAGRASHRPILGDPNALPSYLSRN